jgi:Na+/H+ antiporter NhaD/arsenite permease-like protein
LDAREQNRSADPVTAESNTIALSRAQQNGTPQMHGLRRLSRTHIHARSEDPRMSQRCLPRLAAALSSACALALMSGSLHAAGAQLPSLLGIPIDFILFAITLAGVAILHRHTLRVALIGLAVIVVYKLAIAGFKTGTGIEGLIGHLRHEWVMLVNLLLLLVGFALLSRHFEKSRVPVVLPKFLPVGWQGGFVLLAMIFVLSSFLDNIAAALIGGAMAHQLFRAKVHVGYLAAIVAASNAGGAGSVIGDTTTTMMWIHGVSPLSVLEAYIACFFALAIFGIPAAIQQHRYSPMLSHAHQHTHVDWARVGIVALILIAAMVTNLAINLHFPKSADQFPFIGAAVWAAILVSLPLRRPDWELVPEAFKGSVFLLSLVTAASMMPVETLPDASWPVALVLGFVSAVFDNIPLTALALKQGGYDWGYLAYAVGFGGSMLWFGSSAGVALSNLYPEAKSAVAWVRAGWYVVLAYVIGFAALLLLHPWQADPPHRRAAGQGSAMSAELPAYLRHSPLQQT